MGEYLCMWKDVMTGMSVHPFSVDLITDIPMMITTLVARTYVGSVYISIDIAVKIVLFARALWISIAVRSDYFKVDKVDWRYHKFDVIKTTEPNERDSRDQSESDTGLAT